MGKFTTEQEDFWAGEFGNQYINRNKDFKNNLPLFARIFSRTNNVGSVLEFGANIGLNLKAIKLLNPALELSAIEINKTAADYLKELPGIKIYRQSILDFTPDYARDFVLTKGVLIHINPDHLAKVYERLYSSSNNYICLAEYYHPTPVAVNYRGHQNKLFKRDFAGEMLEKYPDLKLVDYGFVYHRDPNFPLGDITWFLLQKN